MNLFLNLLWALLGGGLVTAILYGLAGLVLCLTIVGIPFGLQCFKIAGLTLFPFGKTFVSERPGPLSFMGNVLWLLLAGLWIFLSHLALAVSLALTIIGIPFAVQHVKLAMVSLMPFGVRIEECE